jgi:uncharacterized protein (DUF2141 family)
MKIFSIIYFLVLNFKISLFPSLLFNYPYNQQLYSLTVKVTDLRNSRGAIQFMIYNKEGSLPDYNLKNYYKKETVTINENSASTIFYNLTKGNYAVVVLHDENNNSKIDKKFIFPTEGIGFSNFQTINLSNRPSFSKASLMIDKNSIKNIKIIYK